MEAEEWKANPIVWGYFIPLNFFFSLSFFFFFAPFSHSAPNALWVCGALSKAYVRRAAQNKSLYDVLLIPALPFDYATIILYLCQLKNKGGRNKLVICETQTAL